MSAYELPGDAWQGWSIRGGQLFNPSGRSYQSYELYYIGNMFQMARYWLSDRKKIRETEIKSPAIERGHLRLVRGGIK